MGIESSTLKQKSIPGAVHSCQIVGWKIIVVVRTFVKEDEVPKEALQVLQRERELGPLQVHAVLNQFGYLRVDGKLFQTFFIELDRLKLRIPNSKQNANQARDLVESFIGQPCIVSIRQRIGDDLRFSGDVHLNSMGFTKSLSKILKERSLAQQVLSKDQIRMCWWL